MGSVLSRQGRRSARPSRDEPSEDGRGTREARHFAACSTQSDDGLQDTPRRFSPLGNDALKAGVAELSPSKEARVDTDVGNMAHRPARTAPSV